MTVGITVPQTPVAASPGTETRIRIEVHNPSADAVSVRLSFAPSRAGAWGQADPPVLELPPGEGGHADLVFRPPSGTGPVATLLPFTVQAEDLRYGVTTARATGLLTISPEQRLTATLARESSAPGVVALQIRLTNRDDSAPLTLKLEPRLEPAGSRVHVAPAVIDVPGGDSATARVEVRPPGGMTFSHKPYQLTVACRDVAAPSDDPPLAVLSDAGTVPARLRARVTLPLLLLVAGLLAAGYLVYDGTLKLPGWLPGGPGGAPAAVSVGRPYALLEVFPQQDPSGRSQADDAFARLNSAGMDVRLVNSLESPDLADGQGGLWVILRDGFGSLDEARAYCDRYRAVAPKCEAFP